MWPAWPSTLSSVRHRLENYLPSVRLHKIQVLCWESSPREQHLTHFRPSQVANKFSAHLAIYLADCVKESIALTHILAWVANKAELSQTQTSLSVRANIANYISQNVAERFSFLHNLIPSPEIIPISSYLEQSSSHSWVRCSVRCRAGYDGGNQHSS